MSTFKLLILLSLIGIAQIGLADTMCPDGNWHADGTCRICPDGSYTTAPQCVLAPSGGYVPGYGGGLKMTPDGNWIPDTGRMVMCPDGSWQAGSSCRMLPDGRWIGQQ